MDEEGEIATTFLYSPREARGLGRERFDWRSRSTPASASMAIWWEFRGIELTTWGPNASERRYNACGKEIGEQGHDVSVRGEAGARAPPISAKTCSWATWYRRWDTCGAAVWAQSRLWFLFSLFFYFVFLFSIFLPTSNF